MLNAELSHVTTPYVVFSHAFEDRPGRLTRQADVLDLYGEQSFHVIGDVWPNGCKYAYPAWLARRALKGLATGEDNHLRLWPEAVMYRTAFARQFKIDEQVKYRPHAAFWLKIYEELGEEFVKGCALTAETYIDVGDRDCFPHRFDGAHVELKPVDLPLTIIVIANNNAETLRRSIRSLRRQNMGAFEVRVCDCGSTDETAHLLAREAGNDSRFVFLDTESTPAAAANKALSGASGEKIALWDLSTVAKPSRFSEQLTFDVDIVGSECAELTAFDDAAVIRTTPDNMLPQAHTTRSLNSMLPPCTMLFDRRLLIKGAFDAMLSDGWDFEFQLRATADPDVSVAKVNKPLVASVTGKRDSFYSRFVRRDVIDRCGKGFVHEWPW